MAFPTTSLISTFTGADEDPLSEGGIWTTGATVGIHGLLGALTRTSNQAGGRAGNALYNVATFGPSSESYCTIPVLPTSGAGPVYCYARLSSLSGAANGYSLDWRNAGGTPTLRLLRIDGGSGTDLGTITQALSANDKIGLEIIGDTLRSYIFTGGAWSATALTATSSTYSAAGYIGFGIADASARIDDYGGGTVVTGTVADNPPIGVLGRGAGW